MNLTQQPAQARDGDNGRLVGSQAREHIVGLTHERAENQIVQKHIGWGRRVAVAMLLRAEGTPESAHVARG